MKYYNYTDLGITSDKTPYDSTKIVETETGVIYMIDSSDQDKLLKSTDKCDTWSTVYEDNGWVIDCIFYDFTTKYLWIARNDGATHPKIRYFDTDDSDSPTEMDQMSTGTAGTYTCLAIFRNNGKIFCISAETQGGNLVYQINKIDVDPMVDSGSENTGGANTLLRWTTTVTYSTSTWIWVEDDDSPYYLYYIDGVGPASISGLPAGYTLTTATNPSGISHNNRGAGLIFTHLYIILTKTATGVEYLYDYDIDLNTYTEMGQFNIILQAEMNSDPDIPEKAFHITEYEVYQFHQILPQLHLIAAPALSGVIIGITDNFLIETGGEVWEYEDVSSFVTACTITYEDMEIPRGYIELHEKYSLGENMLVKIYDMFTDSAGSSSQIIFEGFVQDYEDLHIQSAPLLSPAIEIENIFPTGNYSGRSDQIISSLCDDYTNYCTAGTMSNGTAMGTITFYGDKSMREILDDFALIDGFTWYLTPTGAIDYNNGTVDSNENIAESNRIMQVRPSKGTMAITYVNIKGAFVDGVQTSSTPSTDTDLQQRKGKNPYERTISFLDTNALCTTAASNIESRYDSQANIVTFMHQDSTVGAIQVGETITFQYNVTNPNISSAQYGIRTLTYNAKRGIGYYGISDILS